MFKSGLKLTGFFRDPACDWSLNDMLLGSALWENIGVAAVTLVVAEYFPLLAYDGLLVVRLLLAFGWN